MLLMSQINAGSRRLVKQGTYWVLSGLIPKQGKRQILMTSLIANIAQLTPAHQEIIEELNRHLKIASHPSALLLQVRLRRIWEQQAIPDDDELTEQSHRVLSQTPRYLRYADDATMLLDIRRALKEGQLITRHKTVA